jgi:hypothetical protein
MCPCYDASVKFIPAIARLLSLLAMLSLILGPVVRPAMAMSTASPQATVMDDHAGVNAQVMGEMPCCPEIPKSDCAKDCPLMALCAAIGVQFLTAVPGLNIPTIHAATLTPDHAAELHGLAQRPPPKPPKT